MKVYFLGLLCLFSFSCLSQQKAAKKTRPKNKKELLSEVDYNLILNNTVVNGVTVQTIDIGKIHIASGKLVATDPLTDPSPNALDITLPKGDYPVTLYQALTKEAGPSIALARVELTKNKPVKWVLTVQDSTDTGVLKEGEYFGFGVDAGVAGFYDYEAGKELAAFYSRFPKGIDIYNIFFSAKFKENAKDPNDPKDIGDWINYTFPNSSLNITMFSSGYGDGIYPVYKGIDSKGKLCSVIIDFQVLLTSEGK